MFCLSIYLRLAVLKEYIFNRINTCNNSSGKSIWPAIDYDMSLLTCRNYRNEHGFRTKAQRQSRRVKMPRVQSHDPSRVVTRVRTYQMTRLSLLVVESRRLHLPLLTGHDQMIHFPICIRQSQQRHLSCQPASLPGSQATVRQVKRHLQTKPNLRYSCDRQRGKRGMEPDPRPRQSRPVIVWSGRMPCLLNSCYLST